MDAWSPNDEGYPFGDVAVATMTATTVYRQGLPRQHAARVTSPAGGQFTARLDVGTVSWAEPDVWAFPEKHGLYRYYCPGHNGGVCQYGMCDETRVRDLAELGRAVSEFEAAAPRFKYLSLYYRHTTDYSGQNWACTYTSSEMFTAMPAYQQRVAELEALPNVRLEMTFIHR
jgi:hypothetical protein